MYIYLNKWFIFIFQSLFHSVFTVFLGTLHIGFYAHPPLYVECTNSSADMYGWTVASIRNVGVTEIRMYMRAH